MSTPTDLKRRAERAANRPAQSTKTLKSKARISDTLNIAQSVAHPAIIVSRFAVFVAAVAVVISSVALYFSITLR